MNNSKGQIAGDYVVALGIIFAILLIGFIFVKINGAINSGFQSQSSSIGNNASQASSNANTGLQRGFNVGIIVAVAFSYMGLFITSRLIGTNPMFFFINLFFLIIVLGIAAILGNVFNEATNNDNFVTERAAMPAATFIGEHLLLFGIGAFAIIAIGYFSKPQEGGFS